MRDFVGFRKIFDDEPVEFIQKRKEAYFATWDYIQGIIKARISF